MVYISFENSGSILFSFEYAIDFYTWVLKKLLWNEWMDGSIAEYWPCFFSSSSLHFTYWFQHWQVYSYWGYSRIFNSFLINHLDSISLWFLNNFLRQRATECLWSLLFLFPWKTSLCWKECVLIHAVSLLLWQEERWSGKKKGKIETCTWFSKDHYGFLVLLICYLGKKVF